MPDEIDKEEIEVAQYEVKYNGFPLTVELHTQRARRGEIVLCVYVWKMPFSITIKTEVANLALGHLARAITRAEQA